MQLRAHIQQQHQPGRVLEPGPDGVWLGRSAPGLDPFFGVGEERMG